MLRVSRSGSTTAALNVGYTVGGNATAGSDFVALGSSVTVPAGAASADITVTPINDTLVETAETVIVSLTSRPGLIVGSPGTVTVTIISDDAAPPAETVVRFNGSVAENAEDRYGPFSVTPGETFTAEIK